MKEKTEYKQLVQYKDTIVEGDEVRSSFNGTWEPFSRLCWGQLLVTNSPARRPTSEYFELTLEEHPNEILTPADQVTNTNYRGKWHQVVGLNGMTVAEAFRSYSSEAKLQIRRLVPASAGYYRLTVKEHGDEILTVEDQISGNSGKTWTQIYGLAGDTVRNTLKGCSRAMQLRRPYKKAKIMATCTNITEIQKRVDAAQRELEAAQRELAEANKPKCPFKVGDLIMEKEFKQHIYEVVSVDESGCKINGLDRGSRSLQNYPLSNQQIADRPWRRAYISWKE